MVLLTLQSPHWTEAALMWARGAAVELLSCTSQLPVWGRPTWVWCGSYTGLVSCLTLGLSKCLWIQGLVSIPRQEPQ